MHRFYIEQKIDTDVVAISDREKLHHLKNVLRLRNGDEVVVFDREGNEYACEITRLDKDQAVLAVRTKGPPRGKRRRLVVACAIPKGDKMDDIVNSLTQLGVDSIIPMVTERVVIRLNDEKRAARVERWRRIAASAAQQSQRNTLPVVDTVKDMGEVLSRAGDFDLKLMPALSGARRPLKEVLSEIPPGSILVLIGPEGDFTSQEIEMAEKVGFIPVSLGESVLRVGVAAVAVANYIALWQI